MYDGVYLMVLPTLAAKCATPYCLLALKMLRVGAKHVSVLVPVFAMNAYSYAINSVTILIVLTAYESARILAILPVPSLSHQIVFRPLILELIKHGHEVVLITADPAFEPGKAPTNLTEIDLHNVSYYSWRKEIQDANIGKQNDLFKQIKFLCRVFGNVFEKQLQTKPMQDLIKNKSKITFDLLLLEDGMRSALAFTYIYKIPVVTVSSLGPVFGTYALMGVSSHPLLHPEIMHQKLYDLTIWEKIIELFYHYLIEYLYQSYEQVDHIMLKSYFGTNIPSQRELHKNVDVYLQNTYPIFMDYPSVPTNCIYMGGSYLKPAKILPQDLMLYLNSSNKGVIYVSFGTNVKSSLLAPDKVKIMMRVFAQLPYEVLWKMDMDSISEKPDNIKISSWFPQADLLKHPNIKAFITHGGLQSTMEAIDASIPLIGIPMYGDQHFNVAKYVYHKIGIKLQWESLTDEELMEAITHIINDTSYRKNMERLRAILYDERQTPMERAIWWIEYVLRHGGAKHLRGPAANMSWTEYYELDLIMLVVFTIAIISYISSSFVLWFIRTVANNFPGIKNKIL